MKKTILFDLDGTLTDPKEGITKSIQYALSKLGIYEDCENLLSFIGPPLFDALKQTYKFDTMKATTALNYYRERYMSIGLLENSVLPGIPEVLQVLKEDGYTLAVATSKPTQIAIAICENFDLLQYFDVIIGSEMDGTRVNKAEVIAEVLKQLNASPKDAIMIGDRKHDILGAKKVGITSIGVTFGYAEDGELEEAGADYIISSPQELLSCIVNQNEIHIV